jgi:hypothetical protein
MRRTLLVGGILTSAAVLGVAAFAPGCAGDGAESGAFGTETDGAASSGTKTADGSGLNLNEDGSSGGASSSSGGSFDDSLQTCVHNSDCTSPNLCVGNNGVECAGGFCVPTGKPMQCDDGVPCMTATCDANTNACVFTPNDSACPDGEYCDPTLNCVASLPCSPGDSVCDRLDVTCSGLWTCDPTKLVCVQGPAPCPARANATVTCALTPGDGGSTLVEAGTGDVDCSYACLPGYVDLAGDLNAPVVSEPDGYSGSAGCTCKVVAGSDGGVAYDPPDLGFVDSNCDGIDGTITAAIFVDHIAGSDSNPGTMAAPLQTIHAGITAAANSGGAKTDVYVSTGVYVEQVNMVDGVRLFGGYEASNHWQRSLSSTAAADLYPNATTVVLAQNLTRPTEIQLFTIQNGIAATGQNASGDGLSSIGVLIVGSNAGVVVRGCTITAADGAAGANGGNGSTGGSGAPGNTASGANLGSGGAGCFAGTNGGNGGASVNGVAGGNPGDPGNGVSGGGTPAGGGSGGGQGSCSATASGPGGGGNPPGNNGGLGPPGGNGSVASTNVGSFDANGNYVPPFGSSFGQGGTGAPGGGGGGGGAGGGTAGGTDDGFAGYPYCTNCVGVSSGAGGGGGGGGCGGTGGYGGRGGGGSFGVVAVSSTVTVDACVIVTGLGGAGGNGGNGGPGGQGGGYGGGGGNSEDSECGNQTSGAGGTGSAGGNGGQGGGGAGGAGGPSICVASTGSTTSITGTPNCTNGGGGAGGNGGSNGLATAQAGPTGKAGETN